MRKPFLLAVLLLLAIPQAAAWHLSSLPDPAAGEVVDIRQRVLATRTVNLNDAAPGNLLTYQFPWDPEFSYDDHGHVIRVHLSYTMAVSQTSNGVWNVTVAKELTGLLDSCNIHVETINPVGITLDALLVYAHFEWDCLFTQSTKVHYHYHTIYVNRTSLSGAPNAPTAEVISVKLESEDVVVLSMPTDFEALTGLTGTEFFAMLAVSLAGMTLALAARNPLARVAPALLVMVMGLLFLHFQDSAVIVILASLQLLFAAVVFIMVGLESWRTRKPKNQPPSFFS